VPGDPANVKLTVPRDFVVAEALLAAATDEHGAEGDGA
jgi:2-C-methyl-D-erythritol 4-phosphate cytidylyltransferase